jgi:hypothetical protein
VTLSPIRGGDVVEVRKNGGGATFYAKVQGRARGGELPILPLAKWATWRTCTSREVIGHYRKTKATIEREKA